MSFAVVIKTKIFSPFALNFRLYSFTDGEKFYENLLELNKK